MKFTDLTGWRLFMAISLHRPEWKPKRLKFDPRVWGKR
jgi:hypothetical protein